MTESRWSEGAPHRLDPDVVAGRAIRARREELRLTQRELVTRLRDAAGWNLDTTAMTRIENGTRSLRVSQVQAIADVLEMSPQAMFFDEAALVGDIRVDISRRLRSARADVVAAIQEIEQLPKRTAADPSVLADSGLSVMPDQYPRYVLERLQEWVGSDDAPHARVFDNSDVETLDAIARAVVSDLFAVWTVTSDGGAEEPEARPPHDGTWALS